ncbi:unnamed protein product [Soboliphyme baturini]|uniref:Uncharacterized protein n=1 Tax=Soboliphyme baturini TaxID=241478 RepID=A0A183IXY8_9BILA|nr:unnamed protein product [Soboliphyme baturini]
MSSVPTGSGESYLASSLSSPSRSPLSQQRKTFSCSCTSSAFSKLAGSLKVPHYYGQGVINDGSAAIDSNGRQRWYSSLTNLLTAQRSNSKKVSNSPLFPFVRSFGHQLSFLRSPRFLLFNYGGFSSPPTCAQISH